jgi:hypothetical protein
MIAMVERPSQLWKSLPVERRQALADSFWRESADEDAQLQHMEATMMLARRLNFRVKSVQSLPIERRAKHLSQVADVSDTVATRALIAYHMAHQRPLMGAFLDSLGIAHENGVISAEDVPKPEQEKLAAAVESIRKAFPADDVWLYLRTLEIIDGGTWGEIHSLLPASS